MSSEPGGPDHSIDSVNPSASDLSATGDEGPLQGISPEKRQEWLRMTSPPEGDVVARPSLSPLFAGEHSVLSEIDVDAAHDPIWVQHDKEIARAGEVMVCLLQGDEVRHFDLLDIDVALKWIERLGWRRSTENTSPQSRLGAWFNPDNAYLALDWLVVGRATSMCELLNHLSHLRQLGVGDTPTIACIPERPLFRPTAVSLRSDFESICHELALLESLLNHSCLRLKVSPFPSEMFQFDETVATIDQQGGAASVVKKWVNATFDDTQAWEWCFGELKKFADRALKQVHGILESVILRRREIPRLWDTAKGGGFPLRPITKVEGLRGYVSEAANAVDDAPARRPWNATSLVADIVRVLKNVRCSLEEWRIGLPDGFDEFPLTLTEAQRQLKLTLAWLTQLVNSSKLYLGLRLDEKTRWVRRDGIDNAGVGITPFEVALFRELLIARGTPLVQTVIDSLPGENNPVNRRNLKNRLKQKLSHLEVTVPDDTWVLVAAPRSE